MNISLNWLATHLDLSGKSIKEIDDLLTFAGVEVEGIVSKGIASDKIVVAQIMEAVQHPNADQLKVTQVDAGEGTLRQIVCGAQNYKVGDKVPCALPGAELPGGFTIGETNMRKVESKGMLCCRRGTRPAARRGRPAHPSAGRRDRQTGEGTLRLRRPARTRSHPEPPRPAQPPRHGPRTRHPAQDPAQAARNPIRSVDVSPATTIRIDAPAACPLYTAVSISGVTIKESPAWLKQRLESIGLRPINNIVDVTNFVLHELGQPLHAFDAAKLTGGIVVRQRHRWRNLPRARRIRTRPHPGRPRHRRRIRRRPRPRPA